MKSHEKIFAAAIALGLGAGVTYCAQSPDPTPPKTDGGVQQPVCEDAGGKPGTNCTCDPAKYKPTTCYSGPQGTVAVGACKSGTRSCDPQTYRLTACVGEVVPSAEVCNLTDDDCNGSVDDVPAIREAGVIGYCNSPACDPDHTDAGITCFTGEKGICGAGALECASGGPKCRSFVKAGVAEVCNGVDDDCNGMVDDGITGLGACEADGGVGECAQSEYQCVQGAQLCPPAAPKTEGCDGKDNDCNGKIDDKSCPNGQNIYCCQRTSNSAWECVANPNDGLHQSCRVGL